MQEAGGGSGGSRVTSTRRPTVNDLASYRRTNAVNAPTTYSSPDYGHLGFTASPASPVSNLPVQHPMSSGYSGGRGVGSNATGHISSFAPPPPPPPPAPPAPPSLDAFSAKDSTYQNQLAALKKALADYSAQQGQAKTQYLTGYAGDLDSLKTNRTQGLQNLEDDYASRGLLQSGLYANSLSNLNTDFDKRQAALDQARAAFLAQQSNDFTNFQSEQQLTQQQALQAAAARRAAQYGL